MRRTLAVLRERPFAVLAGGLEGIVNAALRRPPSEAEFIAALQGLPARSEVRHALLQEPQPLDAWHSWDVTPWRHPWLTRDNLRAASAFQQDVLSRLEAEITEHDARKLRYGFVGNLANNMVSRAIPLRRSGYEIDIVLHPQDRFVMSQPGWELSDASIADGNTDFVQLRERGFSLPPFDCVVEREEAPNQVPALYAAARHMSPRRWRRGRNPVTRFLRQVDVLRWPGFMIFAPLLEALQKYDAVFAAQAPYLAYLARRPYLAAQTGGDLWFEAARNDAFGNLQRLSYAKASAILATNPWAYANARRYGFNHVLYVPLLIDTERYSPGPSPVRAQWQAQIGGDFFVLTTARLDRMWKGSDVGLDGFRQFAARNPGARLVALGWGEQNTELLDELSRHGLAGRVLPLPIVGKGKLIDYLRAADCVVDQFKLGYYGATALEAMACGRPVVMRLLRQQYDALCPTGAPPVLDAASPAEVSEALQRLANSEELRRDIAAASRQWIESNHSAAVWGRHYGALLCAVAQGKTLDFTASPLSAPLSCEERDYHAANLAAAPAFPDYII